jgi:hypothetical protein
MELTASSVRSAPASSSSSYLALGVHNEERNMLTSLHALLVVAVLALYPLSTFADELNLRLDFKYEMTYKDTHASVIISKPGPFPHHIMNIKNTGSKDLKIFAEIVYSVKQLKKLDNALQAYLTISFRNNYVLNDDENLGPEAKNLIKENELILNNRKGVIELKRDEEGEFDIGVMEGKTIKLRLIWK